MFPLGGAFALKARSALAFGGALALLPHRPSTTTAIRWWTPIIASALPLHPLFPAVGGDALALFFT